VAEFSRGLNLVQSLPEWHSLVTSILFSRYLNISPLEIYFEWGCNGDRIGLMFFVYDSKIIHSYMI